MAIHCFSIILVRRGNEHPFLVLKTSFSFAIFAILFANVGKVSLVWMQFDWLGILLVEYLMGVCIAIMGCSGTWSVVQASACFRTRILSSMSHTNFCGVYLEVCSLGIVYADPVPDEVGWGL